MFSEVNVGPANTKQTNQGPHACNHRVQQIINCKESIYSLHIEKGVRRRPARSFCLYRCVSDGVIPRRRSPPNRHPMLRKCRGAVQYSSCRPKTGALFLSCLPHPKVGSYLSTRTQSYCYFRLGSRDDFLFNFLMMNREMERFRKGRSTDSRLFTALK